MQCEFNMHGGSGSNSNIRGGYSIDKKDPRLNSYYVPIGLHTYGEDSYYEEPLDEFSMEHSNHPVIDQGYIDNMLFIVTLSDRKNVKRNKTRKHKKR